jgi:hypothetical protein
MSSKVFYSIVALIVLGVIGFNLTKTQTQEPTVRPGTEMPNQGREHLDIANGETAEYGGEVPPTSGTHHPVPQGWGLYTRELPDEVVIHDMEHGGIYISYNQEMVNQETIDKLKALFFEKSRENFDPIKVVMAPRSANKYPIVLSSWDRQQIFQDYDEEAMVKYYLENVNKSPENIL